MENASLLRDSARLAEMAVLDPQVFPADRGFRRSEDRLLVKERRVPEKMNAETPVHPVNRGFCFSVVA